MSLILSVIFLSEFTVKKRYLWWSLHAPSRLPVGELSVVFCGMIYIHNMYTNHAKMHNKLIDIKYKHLKKKTENFKCL